MTRSKQKGTAAETAVVSFLRTVGFPYAERLALQGSKDRGDVTGIPGVVVEVKNEQTYTMSSWLAEAAAETTNARADYGFVAAKPRLVGNTRVGDWMAIMRAVEFSSLRNNATVLPVQLWVHAMSGSSINRDIAKNMKLAQAHAAEAGREWWMVEISPKGVTSHLSHYCVTSLSQMSGLLVRAGYGRLEGL